MLDSNQLKYKIIFDEKNFDNFKLNFLHYKKYNFSEDDLPYIIIAFSNEIIVHDYFTFCEFLSINNILDLIEIKFQNLLLKNTDEYKNAIIMWLHLMDTYRKCIYDNIVLTSRVSQLEATTQDLNKYIQELKLEISNFRHNIKIIDDRLTVFDSQFQDKNNTKKILPIGQQFMY